MTRSSWGVSLPAVGVCLLLGSTLAASKITAFRSSVPLMAPLDTIPFELAGFTGVPNPDLDDNVAKALKASSYITRRYRQGDLNADLFVAFYAQQRAGESMHSPKHCLPGAGWEIWNYETAPLPEPGLKATINKYSISQGADRRVVLYWYQTRERIFASEYLGKVLLARDALLQNSTSAAIVRVIVPDRPEAVGKAFGIAAEMTVQMKRCFGGDPQ
jgi:EpsI family protein